MFRTESTRHGRSGRPSPDPHPPTTSLGGTTPGPERATTDAHRPADHLAPDTDGAGPGGHVSRTDPARVDGDVAAAVGAVLEDLLRRRVAEAADLDPVFGRDVAEPVARFVLEGGKRMRSRLLWWGLRACGGPVPEAALPVAAALELLQTCALIHDDVMDGAPVRRSRPSFHAAWDAAHPEAASPEAAHPEVPRPGAERPPHRPTFGESAAIVAGDLALAWADDAVAAAEVPADRAERVRALWRALRAEMAAGQYLDLHGQATACRSTERAVRTALLKSALYSVQRPLMLGAALAGAAPVADRALAAAGRCAGLAFQLRDDLTDAFGGTAGTGEPPAADVRAGKPTFLVAVAVRLAEDGGDRAALDVLDRRPGAPDRTDPEVAEVLRVLAATGARGAVEAAVTALTERALRHLRDPRAALEPAACRHLADLIAAVAGLPGTPAPGRPEATPSPETGPLSDLFAGLPPAPPRGEGTP